MRPIGGPPPPCIDHASRPAAARVEEKVAARPVPVGRVSARHAVDAHVGLGAQAPHARAPSFDAEKVVRLRELADRGACVPSPPRIAEALAAMPVPEK